MRTIIFSDTHLTPKFNKKLYNFLNRIISEADQVIINGDFWDGQTSIFDAFIHSDWKKLFPLLKSKNTIYIYGNHDRKKYSDERTNLFSISQLDSYSLKLKNKTLRIEHGHEIVPFGDKESDIFIPPKKMNIIYSLGEYFICIVTSGHFLEIYRRLFGKRMKEYIQKNLNKNEILVTGHIHAPEFDEKNQYVNTFLRHNKAYYLEVNGDTLKFIKEKI